MSTAILPFPLFEGVGGASSARMVVGGVAVISSLAAWVKWVGTPVASA